MTVHDLLAEGRLSEAIALQERAVAAAPHDPEVRRLLVALLAFGGRFEDGLAHLADIDRTDPHWREIVRSLHRLLRCDNRRSIKGKAPELIPDSPPKHVTRRWRAIQLLRRDRPDDAVRAVDAADKVSPIIRGFIDGRAFDGLRDADDRFGSILEVFRDAHYLWIPWEYLRKVILAPKAVLLDQLYRPAAITLRNGATLDVYLPLNYPLSHAADGAFALGMETDHVCPDNGPTRCIGRKLLLLGEDDEVALAECRFIEIR
jgi:type VI secretion system protein ImpE